MNITFCLNNRKPVKFGIMPMEGFPENLQHPLDAAHDMLVANPEKYKGQDFDYSMFDDIRRKFSYLEDQEINRILQELRNMGKQKW